MLRADHIIRDGKQNKWVIIIFGLILIFATIIIIIFFRETIFNKPPTAGTVNGSVSPPAFDGDSRELRATVVVPTLETPIPVGKNAIWCASYLATWKAMETDIFKEPISLQGSPAFALSLNKADDPRPWIPESSLYVAAGWCRDGIIDKIGKDLAEKFPAKSRPNFPKLSPEAIVSYAYLDAEVKFSFPYLQNKKPLIFTDLGGTKTELKSFGQFSKNHSQQSPLPKILHIARDNKMRLTECIIDLDGESQPNQIILAYMESKANLTEMIRSLNSQLSNRAHDYGYGEADPLDMLIVPDIVWNITHRFEEIEGRPLNNSGFEMLQLMVAQQDIQFRLDRNGAAITSEARTNLELSPPVHAIFDRPFFLCIMKRGEEMPFFVMWVANAELLCK